MFQLIYSIIFYLQVVYSVAYVIIVYFMTSQPLEANRFMMYLTICVLTALVSQSIGLVIGAAMSVEVTSQSFCLSLKNILLLIKEKFRVSERSIYRPCGVGADRSVLRFLRQFRCHSKVSKISFVRELRKV